MEEKTKEERKKDYESLKELFDKQIELTKLKQKRTPAWKLILFIFTGIAAVSFLAFSCFMMYKQSFTMETLLTVILSFFSIALSIMFYIQSEKSSSQYYIQSYEIMKEVSVALGKIEAGFGEKLTDIKSNIDKLEHTKEVVKDQLEKGEKEEKEIRTRITKDRSSLNEKQTQELLDQLQEKTRETSFLRQRLERMENDQKQIIMENNSIKEKYLSQENVINHLMNNKRVRNIIENNSINNSEDNY